MSFSTLVFQHASVGFSFAVIIFSTFSRAFLILCLVLTLSRRAVFLTGITNNQWTMKFYTRIKPKRLLYIDYDWSNSIIMHFWYSPVYCKIFKISNIFRIQKYCRCTVPCRQWMKNTSYRTTKCIIGHCMIYSEFIIVIRFPYQNGT